MGFLNHLSGSSLLLLLTLQAANAAPSSTQLAPAGATISSDSPAGVPLNDAEKVQLTSAAIDSLSNKLDKKTASYFAFGNSSSSSSSSSKNAKCKVAPGDKDWPCKNVWKTFDSLLSGNLIKATPPAASCYADGNQDAEECKQITNEWNSSYFHMDDPTSVMWPLYQGRTCLPPGENVTSTCTLGGYPSYVANVSTAADIQLAVNFARNANLRLIVKNTGHDFIGKSSGAGALSVWTHHLKSIQYVPDYSSSVYSGPVVKAGSGVQAFELYEFANKHGFSAVGGEGKTVGVAGGYFLGGGHSPLSCLYGLAADQVVAMEVVLPDGTFTTVTHDTNPDLFWALRGGGLASVGIVTSVISKVYPKIGATVSNFAFSTSDKVDADTFFKAVRAYYTHLDEYTKAGTYAYFWIMATGKDQYSFLFNPFFAVNHTVDQFNTMIKGFLGELKDLGIEVKPNSTYYDNYYDAWDAGFPLENSGAVTVQTGSRLFSRKNFVNSTLLDQTLAAHRTTLEKGSPILAFQMKADAPKDTIENSCNPAMRDMLMHAISSVSWNATASNSEIYSKMTYFRDEILGEWRKVTPGGGAYMSEAQILEPNFQQSFFGSNYKRLYKLKQKYDPQGVLYAPTAVGSEDWTVNSADGLPDQNGKLCRA